MTKRILFCIDTLNGGGAEKLLLRYIDILSNHRDYHVTLLVLRKFGELTREIGSSIELFYDNEMSSTERAEFNKLHFDIEIAFLESLAIRRIVEKPSSAVKIGWIHTDMLNYNWCRDCFPPEQQEIYYCHLDYIVCINEYCKSCFDKAFPKASIKTIVCNNILDFKLLDATKNINKNQKDGIHRISFVGRLIREKHPELAVYAIYLLREHGHKVVLDIIGSGYLEVALKDLVKRLNLDNYVTFHGYLTNPYHIIKQSVVLLSLSDIEGGPLTIAEAYYMGIPSIASHSGGADAF